MSPGKYRAVPTVVDGVRFMSKGEAGRYVELRNAERAGTIADLTLQPKFYLHCANTGRAVATYLADFRYLEGDAVIIEDFKGVLTPLYRLKRKWMLLEHGITIRETFRPTRRRRRQKC